MPKTPRRMAIYLAATGIELTGGDTVVPGLHGCCVHRCSLGRQREERHAKESLSILTGQLSLAPHSSACRRRTCLHASPSFDREPYRGVLCGLAISVNQAAVMGLPLTGFVSHTGTSCRTGSRSRGVCASDP